MYFRYCDNQRQMQRQIQNTNVGQGRKRNHISATDSGHRQRQKHQKEISCLPSQPPSRDVYLGPPAIRFRPKNALKTGHI